MEEISIITTLVFALACTIQGCGGSGGGNGNTDAGYDAGTQQVDSGTDAGFDAGPVDPCVGTPAHGGTCYNCAPTTDLQFLNHCYSDTVDCEPFDNSRIPAP